MVVVVAARETRWCNDSVGNMSSIDFDEVLVHVGEKGKYQNIMYYLLCISATLPAAFLAFSQVSLRPLIYIPVAWLFLRFSTQL